MKDKLIIFLKQYPVFLYLLPIFFILHGCVENFGFVPLMDALTLTSVYLGFTFLFLVVFHLLYKSWAKAAILSFFLMAFHFFFGAVQDGIRGVFHDSFLSRYLFILPFFLILFLIAIIVLKRRKRPFRRLILYLNVLFILLTLVDTISLFNKMIKGGNEPGRDLPREFVACPTCKKPDIYLIIADEYAGNKELKDIFRFDDSAFLTSLAHRDFKIVQNSSSNYNYTPYSIASILNMDYLDLNRLGKQPLLPYTYEAIAGNRFLQFLQYHQYKFYNYSFFDFKGQPTYTQETFLPVKTRLITGQTFLSRISKELRFLLVTKLKSKDEIKKDAYFNRNNNERLYALTVKTAEAYADEPRFVLTHLMMPHYPYYYDENGNEFPFETLAEGNQVNQRNYIAYLQYTNKKLLALVDDILRHSAQPPIIVLMGDHGFRHFTSNIDPKYYFCNLVSVHLPVNDYSAFTDSLTNVNLLRTVLNVSFNQHLPALRDTAIIMDNP